MALTMTGSKPYKTTIPEETYLAICVGIYDLGTVESERFKSSDKKVLLLFEFPELKDEEGWPLTINKTYTQSLNKKANLYKDLVGWRGKNFAVDETKRFDLRDFLGKPALIQVIHALGTGDREGCVWANINAINAVPRTMSVPPPSRKPLCFDFDDGVASIPDGCPEFVERMIVAAPEWADLKAGRKPGAKAVESNARKQAPEGVIEYINQMGLAWPYNDDELDNAFKPDLFGDDVYQLLKSHSTPF